MNEHFNVTMADFRKQGGGKKNSINIEFPIRDY